jgi:hypothetical protein
MKRNRLAALWAIALVGFASVPSFSADRVIYNGIDLWRTIPNGVTYADFLRNPLPAGFFCWKSEPFSGRINFKGVPVATNVPGALGSADTILQRLDDATFNKRGVARTRLQVRSLNFESVAPVQTACGAFIAKVALDGEQPLTEMRIIRENAKGGRFIAPISVNVKISFTPVGRPAAEPLEVRKSLRFPAAKNQRWEYVSPQETNRIPGFLLVDTDGDRTPDTYLPGTSNFGVGMLRQTKECFTIHDDPNCSHGVC